MRSNRKFHFFVTLGLVLALSFWIKANLLSLRYVNGDSMNSGLLNGDFVFISKFKQAYRPGDILVFESPKTDKASRLKEESVLIKRLIASGPANIYIDNFRVFVNSAPYEESTQSPPNWGEKPFDCKYSDFFQIARGEYFVLGDNRCSSTDSRSIGPIKETQILGKVIYQF